MTQQSDEPKDTRFKPGQSGNPAGRKKGSRAKISEEFLRYMFEDFSKHGVAVIAQVRLSEPTQYLKIVAGLLPKEITGEDGEAIGLTVIINKP